ncbi:MAG TPA: sigma-70 family RNA polymerase sigma factor [Gemmataceae bacterium]|nr:sigma-70 family RNA polymerase sigma factor [Gemmataceae bacterium]
MSPPSSMPLPHRPDPACWVDEHGNYLYRYALARVGSPEAAEDLVQETFLAALAAVDRFAGRATERTWLTGILKHKLIDRVRHCHREAILTDLSQADDWLNQLYDWTGHWKAAPGRWGSDPVELLQQEEFCQAFERCRQALPARLREVLSLRLLDDVPATEICQALGISATNLWTLLHRARLRLWHCLEQKGLVPKHGKERA